MKNNVTSNIRTNTQEFSRIGEINGHEADQAGELSEAEQKLYADVCQLLKSAGQTTALQELSTDLGQPVATENSGLTKTQWKLVLLVIFLAALALAVAFLR